MTPEEIKRNAPEGATHHCILDDGKTIVYAMNHKDGIFAWLDCDGWYYIGDYLKPHFKPL